MDPNSFLSKIAFTLVIFLAVGSVWADPTIIANTLQPFTVTCDTVPPTTMQIGGITHLDVPLGPKPGGVIQCSFNMVQNGAPVHQRIVVEPTALASVECDIDSCQWTVAANGFYVLDISSNTQVLGDVWLPGQLH